MAPEKKTAEKKPAKAAAPKAPKAPRAPKPAPVMAATSSNAQVDLRNPLQKRKEMTGIVVSDKMQKTIVVKIDRRVRHGLYMKYIVKSHRFKAHDEKNEAKVGDVVVLVESRPLSREKRWALQSITRRAGQVIEANV
jgi:small subunit ribosomal protein S17